MPHKVVADAGEAPERLLEATAELSCRAVVAHVSRWRVVAGLQVAEALAVGTSASSWLTDIVVDGAGKADFLAVMPFAGAVAVIVHLVLRSVGAYGFSTILSVWRSSAMAAVAWMVATAPVLAWSIALDRAPWHSIADWLTGVAFIVLVRLGAGTIASALLLARRISHNVLVVGGGSEAQSCLHILRSDPCGENVVGFVPVHEAGGLPCESGGQADFLAWMQEMIRAYQVRDVIVATPDGDRGKLGDLIRGFLCLPVRVLLWPPSIGLEPEWVASSECKVGDMPLLVVSAPPLDGWHWVLKDVQDRFLAVLLLLVCSPALLGISVLIRLSSPGPVLFRQEREGYNGNKFVIYKFRTMYPQASPTDRLVLTEKSDSRVFPLGAFLRKTSLDELPQLLNVIRGDMWLVGPRPHSPLATAAGQRYAAAAKRYMARFRVKPGMTGWAQVNGWRGSTDTVEQIQQRVVHDLYYIENWSVWLDFKILLQTAFKGFVHQNAY
jgi:Undecaprenyl-phosphate glucose phosphotransferase